MREKYGLTGRLLTFGNQITVSRFVIFYGKILTRGVAVTIQRGFSTEPDQLSSSAGTCSSIIGVDDRANIM
jgi:hypothetical protein